MKAAIFKIVNQPGSLRSALDILNQKSINLNFLASYLIGEKYGVAYIIPESESDLSQIRKYRAPEWGNNPPLICDVLTVHYKDQQGSLKELLDPVAEQQINIEFCYSFSVGRGKAIAILGVPERMNNKLVEILQSVEVVIKIA
jgi:hypothetical protein